jgi:hypothetical protein
VAYIVYIDLSAKVEQWTRHSAVAVSNDTSWVLLVPSKVKQQARRMLSARHGTKNLQYRLLAVVVYLAKEVFDGKVKTEHVLDYEDIARLFKA